MSINAFIISKYLTARNMPIEKYRFHHVPCQKRNISVASLQRKLFNIATEGTLILKVKKTYTMIFLVLLFFYRSQQESASIYPICRLCLILLFHETLHFTFQYFFQITFYKWKIFLHRLKPVGLR